MSNIKLSLGITFNFQQVRITLFTYLLILCLFIYEILSFIEEEKKSMKAVN